MTVKKKSVKKASVKKAVAKKKIVNKRKSVIKSADAVDEHGLNPSEREFADHWRGGDEEVRRNAKRSYMKVFPKAKETTAEVEGSKKLRLPKIQAYLRFKSEELSEKSDINAQWLLERLAEEATADIADIYDENGSLLPVHTWPKIWRQGLVAGLDVHQEYAFEDGKRIPDGVVMKVKISDRIKRLELIGKHVDVKAFDGEANKGVNITVVIEDKDSKA